MSLDALNPKVKRYSLSENRIPFVDLNVRVDEICMQWYRGEKERKADSRIANEQYDPEY